MHMAKATEFRVTKGMCAEHAVVQGMLWNHPLLGSRLGEWHPTALFLFHANTSGIPFQPQKIKKKQKKTPFKSKLHVSHLGSIQRHKHYSLLPSSLLG